MKEREKVAELPPGLDELWGGSDRYAAAGFGADAEGDSEGGVVWGFCLVRISDGRFLAL